jgi:hypothetical protein
MTWWCPVSGVIHVALMHDIYIYVAYEHICMVLHCLICIGRMMWDEGWRYPFVACIAWYDMFTKVEGIPSLLKLITFLRKRAFIVISHIEENEIIEAWLWLDICPLLVVELWSTFFYHRRWWRYMLKLVSWIVLLQVRNFGRVLFIEETLPKFLTEPDWDLNFRKLRCCFKAH